jgi:hypothetical protein
MRKIVFCLAIIVALLVAIAAGWIFAGRSIALFSESFGTVEVRSNAIKSIAYNGNGSGGTLKVNDVALDLTPAMPGHKVPEIGSSKDGQVALSYGGKVFSFGAPTTSVDDSLATTPAADDHATLEIRRSILAWPNPFEVNFMTGNSPSWKRFSYQRLVWKKSNEARLEMIWRCEQFLYPNNDWSPACMTDSGFTGLLRVEILNPTR